MSALPTPSALVRGALGGSPRVWEALRFATFPRRAEGRWFCSSCCLSIGGDGAGRVTLGPAEMGPRGLLGAQFPCAAGGGGGARVCRYYRDYRTAPVTGGSGAAPVPRLSLLPGPTMLPGVPPGLWYRYCGTTGDAEGTAGAARAAELPDRVEAPRLLVLPGLLPPAAVPAESGSRERGGGRRSPEDASLPLWI